MLLDQKRLGTIVLERSILTPLTNESFNNSSSRFFCLARSFYFSLGQFYKMRSKQLGSKYCTFKNRSVTCVALECFYSLKWKMLLGQFFLVLDVKKNCWLAI